MSNENPKVMSSSKIRKMTVTAILSAFSSVLMFFSFNIPFMPNFIELDFSELPALIATFAYGPISGISVCLVKNLVNLLFSKTAGVGELSNFILGVAFVFPAGIIYKYKKSRLGALVGSCVGAAAMAVVGLFSNYYIVYPVYAKILPMETIIAAYSTILPSVTNLWQALLIFNLPFTFCKAIISVIIAFLIYKPLHPILKNNKF